MTIRILLTGQKAFGAAVLGSLLTKPGVELVGVVAPGAGEDRLKVTSANKEVPWTPSESFGAENVPEGTDLIVAAHSHAFLSAKARDRTKYGAIGYHPSLLPRHRGRDAVRWTIHMKDAVAGGTVYYFTNNVDAGPIVLQDWCHVKPRWTYRELWSEALFPMGVRLLDEAVSLFQSHRQSDWWSDVRLKPQDPECVTWEPSWERPPLHRPDLLELRGWSG